ncbi:MAG: hypothetical protein IMZ44_05020 [Planctomycetes bacterium]|nr:hypothetical protein [Planctomycetota bacterium]
MNRITLAVAVLLLASLVGCLPEEKVVWSPDGQRAAVIAPDGLYLCDGDGRLSPRVAEGVSAAAWLPDSKRLLVVRDTKEPAKTWKDAAALVDEDLAKAVVARAQVLRQEILALKAPAEEFRPKGLEQVGVTELMLAAMYMRDNLAEGLPEKLGKGWDEVKQVEMAVLAIEVGEVSADAVALRPVAKVLSGPAYPRLSPNGRQVAYVTSGLLPKGQFTLMVMPLAGGQPRVVAEQVAAFVDWSADGRYLLFARTTGPAPKEKGDLRLGTVSRTVVCDEKGGLLEKFPLPQDLAGLVFQDTLRVRGLRDGRILFAAAPIQLPSTTADMPTKAALFAVDPERPATLIRMLSRNAEADVPQGVNYFQLSPDQRHVLIPGPKGVAVVTLATGEVVNALAEKEGDLTLQPVWRSPSEVCFAVAKGSTFGSPNRPEVVLWSAGHWRVLSKAWPDAMVNGMLQKPGDPQPKPLPPTGPGKPPEKKEESKKAP